MAHDDMHVVMYKILGYLYDCLKRGVEPSARELAHDGMCGIPYPYWERIIRELHGHGYIGGVDFAGDGVYFTGPYITMEGVEFLQENTAMRKALAFLKEAKSALPFI